MRSKLDSDKLELPLTVRMPPSSSAAARTRRRRAVEHTLNAVQNLFERLTPDELESVAARIEQAVASPPATDAQMALARKLSGGGKYSAAERVALETESLIRSFRRRQELLANSLSTVQVAQLLGTSRQTPHDRARSGSLLAIQDNGTLRFPAWQFDPEGPDRVVPGLPRVLRVLPMSPLAKANWLTRANPYLEGRRPIDALKAGDVERVVDVGRGLGAT